MTRYFIAIMSVWFFFNQTTYADIKNGYEDELKLSIDNLRNLDSLLESSPENDRLISVHKSVLRRSKMLEKKYSRTQELLDMFKEVSPGIYNAVNQLRDYTEHSTDVYVCVIDETDFTHQGVLATTNVAHSKKSSHVYHSEYGDHSASIKIAHLSHYKMLKVLAHEFGHVLYQVPNLASYWEYFQKTYLKYDNTIAKGHAKNDPSHLSVKKTLRKYLISFSNHRKSNGNEKENIPTDLTIAKKE